MEVHEVVLSLLHDLIPDGRYAIDLGMGPGRITDVLQARGFDVYGCDIEPSYAREALARGVHADAADVLTWEPPVRADVITCMELIEHLPRHQQPVLLDRIRRWLAPGGTAIVSTPQRHSLVATVERAYCAVRRQPYTWWDPTHIAVRSRGDIVRMCSAAGFTIERVVGVHLVPQLAGEVLPPLRRYQYSRHEGWLAGACFDLTFVLREAGGQADGSHRRTGRRSENRSKARVRTRATASRRYWAFSGPRPALRPLKATSVTAPNVSAAK